MGQFIVNQIGKVKIDNEGMRIEIFNEYQAALKELDGFSHVNVLWWCSDFDNEQSRKVLETHSPYKGSPDVMGIFATRSPIRPNPIALTASQILYIDHEKTITSSPYCKRFMSFFELLKSIVSFKFLMRSTIKLSFAALISVRMSHSKRL